MANSTQKLTELIFIGAILICLCAASGLAQELGVYVPIKKATTNKRVVNNTTRRTTVNRTSKVSVVVREIVNTKLVKTSNLSVTTQPGAMVKLESLAANVNPPAAQKVNSSGVVIFENLKAIKYKVVVTLDGFETLEQDSVAILPQKTLGIKLDLKPITYDLKIDTNIADGEVRFAPAVLTSTDNEGNLITKETGGFCVVKIVNKKAVIPELKQGYYNLEIIPSAVEYQSLKVAVKVPDDILEDNDDNDELQSYPLELEKKISTTQFASAWTSNEWDLPAGWGLKNKMQNNGLSGIALPRNDQYRYYVDFEMITNVNLIDDNTVGFVFRAQDAQNYYLVQLSGARAAEPYRATGYVVKKGRAEQIFSITIEAFAEILKKQFRFSIQGEGKLFKLFIEDSTTGDKRPLGNMTDPFNNFKKGAVGIAGNSGSKFEVVFFTVLCKGVCR
ncbi:hypothetical protein BH10ACI1_BH10ACI1_30000 [soil metagenome]